MSRAIAIGAFALCAGVLALHAESYLPFFVDDSFISLRYAARLLDGKGLTWTDGERVEGFSNLLWVLVTAGLGALGVELVIAARSLGLLCVAASLFAMFYAVGRRAHGSAGWLWPTCGALALAAAGPVAAWSLGGLEQPMVVALLAWAIVTSERLFQPLTDPRFNDAIVPSVLLGLLTMTRPDGAVFSAAFVLALLIVHGWSWRCLRASTWLLLAPASCFIALLVFRHVYYDAWVPNTYYAKGAFTWQRMHSGFEYVVAGIKHATAVWVGVPVAMALAAFDREARSRLAAPLACTLLWVLYVMRIGGDISPQHRHLVPCLWLAAYALCVSLDWLWRRAAGARWHIAIVALVPALLSCHVLAQRADPERARALNDTWHWTGRPVGRFLGKVFEAQRPLLAVDAAGALPYYYRLPCLDMLGLTDRYIATHPPPGIGAGYVGHELGDGKYVLSRKPDLVAFWTPVGSDHPKWRSGHEMIQQADWKKHYRPVTFETDDGTRTQARLWVRFKDGRLGITESDERVVVPGYLLSGNRASIARLDANGKLGMTLDGDTPARLTRLKLGAGTWTVELRAAGPAELYLTSTKKPLRVLPQTQLTPGTAALRELVDLEVRVAPGATAHVQELVFHRVET